MARSLDELYAQIARLPAADRLRLAARILNELAAEIPETTAEPAAPAPAPGKNGKAPAVPNGRATARVAAPAPAAAAESATRFIVVDGSNLLGRLPGFELNSPASREKLELRLQEYAHAHPRARVTLYFDGQQASAARRGGIEIRYSPRSHPADHFILEYLGRLTQEQRRSARLITADRELSDAAQALGVSVETPEQFQRQVAGPPRAPADRGLSKAEVAEWEEYFRRPREEH